MADRRVSGLVILAVFVALSQSSALPRHKRQTGGLNQGYGSGEATPQFSPGPVGGCQQGEVGFMNCTHYFECSTDGVRTPIRCAAGTVANPNGDDIFTICTWSDEVPECRASHQQTNEVDPRLQDACNVPTSSDIRPGQAYHVPHPLYCNGYLTCGRGQVFLACVICAQGTIFSPGTGRCLPGGENDCQPGTYVLHDLVTNTTLYDDTCRSPGGPGEPLPQGQGPFNQSQGHFNQGQGPFNQGQGSSSQEQGQGIFGGAPFQPQRPPSPPGRGNPQSPGNPFGQQQNQGGIWYRRY